MTEGSRGAPDPDKSVERPVSSDSGAVVSMIGGPAQDQPPEPVPLARDSHAVSYTDALIDALGGRHPAGPDPFLGLVHDPAVGLLRALLKDVSEPSVAGPADQAPEEGDRPGPPRGPRRGSRTIVALGVAGAVLASGGVAAAGPAGAPVLEQDAGPVEDVSKAPPTGPTEAGTTVLATGGAPARRPSAPDRDRPSEAKGPEDAGNHGDRPRRLPLVRFPFQRGDLPYRSPRTGRTGPDVFQSREGADCEEDGQPRMEGGVTGTTKGWRLKLDPTPTRSEGER